MPRYSSALVRPRSSGHYVGHLGAPPLSLSQSVAANQAEAARQQQLAAGAALLKQAGWQTFKVASPTTLARLALQLGVTPLMLFSPQDNNAKTCNTFGVNVRGPVAQASNKGFVNAAIAWVKSRGWDGKSFASPDPRHPTVTTSNLTWADLLLPIGTTLRLPADPNPPVALSTAPRFQGVVLQRTTPQLSLPTPVAVTTTLPTTQMTIMPVVETNHPSVGPDGTITPGSDAKLPDNSSPGIIQPDGTIVFPDGTVVGPEASIPPALAKANAAAAGFTGFGLVGNVLLGIGAGLLLRKLLK